ncbi:ribonuclease H-like domain-containing protein [Tanacetum coccineum]
MAELEFSSTNLNFNEIKYHPKREHMIFGSMRMPIIYLSHISITIGYNCRWKIPKKRLATTGNEQSGSSSSKTAKQTDCQKEFRKINTAGGTNSSSQVSSTPGADEVVCSFFAQQTTSPPLDNEDLQQIDQDDLEELDIRWQVAMLTVRVQRFIKKTGRNLDFKGKQPVTFDKSQVECYNCHRKGHFAKECKSGWNQGKRSYGDNGRRNATTNEPSSQALVAQDGLGGYDWSNDFDEPVNYALMAISSSSSSSSSDNEVQNCSKQCLESFKILQKNFDSEREKHSRARLEIQGYELALESLESRILGHEKNELAWGEKYEFQNYELKCRELKINNLNMELEKVVKERDELNIKIAKWEESSKSLNILLNSQMSAHDKNGLGYGTQLNEMSDKSETDSEISMSVFEVRSSDEESTPANDRFSKADGYHVVPPPITGNFLTPRADISFAGLDEYAIRKKIIESKTTELNADTSKSKTSETVGNTNEVNVEKPKSVNESVVSTPNINKDKVIIEDWNSDDEDDVFEVSPVKTNETQTAKTQVDKIGQTSKKAGIGFKKIKACFVCKSTDHLIKDCDFYDKKSPEPKLKNMVNTGQRVVKPVWDNAKRVNHQKISNKLNYPQARRTFVPSGVLTRTGLVNLVRPNEKRAVQTINTARPVSTARSVSTARPFAPKTAQTSSVVRPIYPRMDNVRPRASYSPIKRSYYTKPAFRPKNLKQDVKTFGIKNMTTAGTRAVVNTGKGKMDNTIKKSSTNHGKPDVPSVYKPNEHETLFFVAQPAGQLTFIKPLRQRFTDTPNTTNVIQLQLYYSLDAFKQLWQTATIRTLANGTQELVASSDNKVLYYLLRHLLEVKLSIGRCCMVLVIYMMLNLCLVATLGAAAEDQGYYFHPSSSEANYSGVRVSIRELTTTSLWLDEGWIVVTYRVSSHGPMKSLFMKVPLTGSAENSLNQGIDGPFNPGSEDFNTGNEDFNIGSLGVSTEGKAPMTTEEIQATKRTKAQIQQEEVGLAEAMRLQASQEEEAARQVLLDDFAELKDL